MKKKRLLAGLSQHEIARRAGVKFSRLHYAESRRLKLTAEEQQRVELVLVTAMQSRVRLIVKLLGTRLVANV